MSYVLVQEGVVVAYPYSFGKLRSDNPAVSYPRNPDDAWLANQGVHKVTPAARPGDHPSIVITEGTPALVEGVWTQVWEVTDAPAPSKTELAAYAASKRWEKEIGGIVVAGAAIDTSRESQSMIGNAYSYSQAHPSEVIKFKAASGWISIDAATVVAIAASVGAHVQACFAIEESVAAEIEAGTITTYGQVDEVFA